MKYFLILSLLLLSSLTVVGQEEDATIIEADSTLIIDGDTLGYYYNDFQPFILGSVELSNSPDGYLETFSGGLGVIWKNHWIAGGFASSFQADLTQKLIFPNDFLLSYKHGGFFLGYRSDRKRIFDFRFVQNVSFGEMVWEKVETSENFLADKFVMIHPSFGVDVNLSRYAKLIGTVGYRKVVGLSLAQAPPEDFDGPTFQLGVSFGLFNYLKK